MNKFIVVDYQEGAGGEFLSRFLSAHYGHEFFFDQQQNPDPIQKYLNFHSIINLNWDSLFPEFFQKFLDLCRHRNITEIAIPYHLYKWPQHIKHIIEKVSYARFVKICCKGYEDKIQADFQRKILDRPIGDFGELQFLLTNQDRNSVKDYVYAWKQGNLKYKDIFPNIDIKRGDLPSNDIKIDYGDFFCNFNQTTKAYEKLCDELSLTPNSMLLMALLERNKKNQHDLQDYMKNQ
jgi:hypothetical protein